jgi:hypothetical protein
MFFGENEYSRTELRESVSVPEGIEAVSIDCCVVFFQSEESGFWVSWLLYQTYPTSKDK